MATLPDRPDVRHIFRVQDASSRSDTTPVSSECLSCNATLPSTYSNSNVSTCQYARASISTHFNYYVLDCLGPTVPYSLVFSLPDNKFTKVLDTNEELKEALELLAMPQTQFVNYDILDEASAPARVKLLLPPGYREEEFYTFPLVLRV